MPHFLTNPELNPHLTPPMIERMRKQTFQHCVNDYLDFDAMVRYWNEDFEDLKRPMKIYAYPNRNGIGESMAYGLRPKGKSNRRHLYTFVDPRRYGWTATPADNGGAAGKKTESGRITKNVKRKTHPRPKKWTAKPDIWYFDYDPEMDGERVESVRSASLAVDHDVRWAYRDGHIFSWPPEKELESDTLADDDGEGAKPHDPDAGRPYFDVLQVYQPSKATLRSSKSAST